MRVFPILVLYVSLGLIWTVSAPSHAEVSDDARAQAENGSATAQFLLGLRYFSGQGVPEDYSQAAAWFLKAAEQGDADAQFSLGILYTHGKGVPQSDSEAVTWYRKAAEQGNADAQYSLAQMYGAGQGVPRDYSQAVAWYRKAAEQGNADAQFFLSLSYVSGQGVPQDDAQAYMWANLSAACAKKAVSGSENVTDLRNSIKAKLTPSQIEEGQRLTREWLTAHPNGLGGAVED